MHTSSTSLASPESARLIKRLCAHWAHKFTVESQPGQGLINFGDSQCRLSGDASTLHIQLQCPDPVTSNRMQQVVFDHLQRMGKHELPAAVWSDTHVE